MHGLKLRSVYDSTTVAGEPLYTTANPDGKGSLSVRCVDYLFFSTEGLQPTKVLGIPPLMQLNGDDPRESAVKHHLYWQEPPLLTRNLFNRQDTELKG